MTTSGVVVVFLLCVCFTPCFVASKAKLVVFLPIGMLIFRVSLEAVHNSLLPHLVGVFSQA